MRLKKSFVNIGTILYTVIQFNYYPPKDEDTIAVECPGKSILFLSRRNSRLTSDNLEVNLLSKRFNKFYIISPGREEFLFQVKGESFHISKISRELSTRDLENLFYALAYEEYSKGNSVDAVDILTCSSKDKYLVKTVVNSFTAKERQVCTDILFKAAHDRKLKISSRHWEKARHMEGQLVENEVIDKALCFLELLELFEKNEDNYIPLPPERYRRIGRKVTDHYNAFKRDDSVILTASFKDLVYTKEKLNISIRYEIPGFVTINPRQARKAGLKTNVFDAKIYREQTLIRDGEINVDKFQVLVSADTLMYLTATGTKDLFQQFEEQCPQYPGYTLVEIKALKLQVINKSYALLGDSLDYILDACYEQKVAECKQKVIRYMIEKLGKSFNCESLPYTKEQYELLQSFGLESNGIYQGIDNKLDDEPYYGYEYKSFEFGLKGFSTLPKVEGVISKIREGKKKFNKPETIMANFIKYLRENYIDSCREQLTRLLSEQKSIIRKDTRILAQIKLVKALTGSWWEGGTWDSKNKYCYQNDDKTLIIKVIRKNVRV